MRTVAPAEALGSRAAMTGTVAGQMARALAARLVTRGYQVTFPPGRDSATFKVDGLPGRPDTEVSAEDDGRIQCHYTSGCLRADE
jgi:hypothetical protein